MIYRHSVTENISVKSADMREESVINPEKMPSSFMDTPNGFFP